MKQLLKMTSALVLAGGAASAGGLDRADLPYGLIFEDGNYAELAVGHADGDVTGSDLLGNSISDVAGSFNVVSGGLKYQFNENLSAALLFNTPYGANVLYGGSPASTMLGGTMAKAESRSFTALLKYNFNENISVYGGPRYVTADGEITLSGLAYGAANGYNVKFASDSDWGYVIGAAYEKPDIALRVSLTYISEVDLALNSTEAFPAALGGATVNVGNTNTTTPSSITLAFQTGVATDTLVFGSIKRTEWSVFTLTPPALGSNLAQLDDTNTFTLGVGRRFTEKFAASISLGYESGGSDDLVSPLAPTNGQRSIALGASYQATESVKISGGIRYTELGDALPETGTPDTARGTFADNDAISFGIKVGFSF